MIQLTSTQLRQAAALKEKIQKLETELGRLLGGSAIGVAPKKRKMTAAGRARIVAAVKARWARQKAAAKK